MPIWSHGDPPFLLPSFLSALLAVREKLAFVHSRYLARCAGYFTLGPDRGWTVTNLGPILLRRQRISARALIFIELRYYFLRSLLFRSSALIERSLRRSWNIGRLIFIKSQVTGVRHSRRRTFRPMSIRVERDDGSKYPNNFDKTTAERTRGTPARCRRGTREFISSAGLLGCWHETAASN